MDVAGQSTVGRIQPLLCVGGGKRGGRFSQATVITNVLEIRTLETKPWKK